MNGFRGLTALALACGASAVACSSSSSGSPAPIADAGGTPAGTDAGGGGGGEDAGPVAVMDAGTTGTGGPTGACYMGAANLCMTGATITTCSAAGGTTMSTCPEAGLAGCCTTAGTETCYYTPTTTATAMAMCSSGMFSQSP
jgi:hypothetical protein